jgi:hypothetical protein
LGAAVGGTMARRQAGSQRFKGGMSVTDPFAKLGAPNLELEGLQIWVHGRQFPDSNDYWDGNWLRVTAHCGRNSATSLRPVRSFISQNSIDGWSKRKSF